MPRKFSWAEQALMDVIRFVVALYPIGLGVAVLASGPDRWASPAWSTLLNWADYWVWGVALVCSGLLALLPGWRPAFVGYALSASWFWLWASSFVANLLDHSDSALTGIPTYSCIALVYTAYAVATWMDRDSD